MVNAHITYLTRVSLCAYNLSDKFVHVDKSGQVKGHLMSVEVKYEEKCSNLMDC